MAHQSGITENGIPWSVTQLDNTQVQIEVGNDQDIYTCQYPTLFGLDVTDVQNINIRLEEMIKNKTQP